MLDILYASAALSLLVLTGFAAATAYQFIPRLLGQYQAKLAAEGNLLSTQAHHVEQTRQAEFNLLKETVEAHEKNGANKLRGELSRISEAEKLEDRLGFKLQNTHVSRSAFADEQERLNAVIDSLRAENAKLVADLVPAGGLSKPSDLSAVFNGQPSPGSSIPV